MRPRRRPAVHSVALAALAGVTTLAVATGDVRAVVAAGFAGAAGVMRCAVRDRARRAAEDRRRRALDRRVTALLDERRAAEERRRAVAGVGRRLSADAAPPAIAEAVLRGAEDLAGATAGAVYGLDEWGAPLRLLASRGTERPPSEVAVVVRGDGPYAVPDRPGEPLHGCGDPVLMLPLRRGPFLVGAVWIAGPDLCPDAARGEELLHMAAQAAVALDTARAVHAAMREAETVRAVVDADPDGIHLVDPEGRTLLANRPFRALADAAVAGPDGLPGVPVVREDARVALAAETGTEFAGDHTYLLAGSGRAVVRYTAPVRDSRGGLLGRVFIHRDVTAERDAERLKDEFLALVSHELRTPLTSVVGYTEVLLEGELGALEPGQERAVAIVERNARRLQRLVGDLLVVAQAQAGRLSVIPERLDLGALVEERMDAFAPMAAEAGVRLTGARTERPMYVDGDRERLGQVLDNLIGNALSHTPRGGAISVVPRTDAGAHEVRIADTGPGVPAEQRERVFETFYRGGASHAAGAGLGLAISRAIARAHGGDLRFAGDGDGPGAVIVMTVPAAVTDAPAAAAVAAPAGAR